MCRKYLFCLSHVPIEVPAAVLSMRTKGTQQARRDVNLCLQKEVAPETEISRQIELCLYASHSSPEVGSKECTLLLDKPDAPATYTGKVPASEKAIPANPRHLERAAIPLAIERAGAKAA
jgi:hypothetical protein